VSREPCVLVFSGRLAYIIAVPTPKVCAVRVERGKKKVLRGIWLSSMHFLSTAIRWNKESVHGRSKKKKKKKKKKEEDGIDDEKKEEEVMGRECVTRLSVETAAAAAARVT